MKEYYEKNKLMTVLLGCLIAGIGLIAFKKSGEPAAEDRVKMDENARIMSDTIKANIEQTIDKVMQEVSVPSGVVFVAPGTPTNGAANTATAQPKK